MTATPQEALPAELRRLARQWRLRTRTVANGGRVGVARVDEQPWDPDERAAIERVNDALGHTADEAAAGQPPPATTSRDPFRAPVGCLCDKDVMTIPDGASRARRCSRDQPA